MVICSLGIAFFAKKVRDLFTKDKEIIFIKSFKKLTFAKTQDIEIQELALPMRITKTMFDNTQKAIIHLQDQDSMGMEKPVVFASKESLSTLKINNNLKLQADMSITPITSITPNSYQFTKSSSKVSQIPELPYELMEKVFSYCNIHDYENCITAYQFNLLKKPLEDMRSRVQDMDFIRKHNNYLRSRIPNVNDFFQNQNVSPEQCAEAVDDLQKAATFGDVKHVQTILNSRLTEVEPFDTFGHTPAAVIKFRGFDWDPLQKVLVLAAENNHHLVVKALMLSEWYRNTCSYHGKKYYRIEEALQIAVMNGSQETVEEILSHEATLEECLSDECLIQAIVSSTIRISYYNSSLFI